MSLRIWGDEALVARFLGAGSREETQRTVHTALALSLIFGAVLLLLGELTAVPLLKLLGTKEELIDGATIYLRSRRPPRAGCSVLRCGSPAYRPAKARPAPLRPRRGGPYRLYLRGKLERRAADIYDGRRRNAADVRHVGPAERQDR